MNIMNVDFWKSRRVLVTGGCGFLGSYLTEELVALGAHVTVADNLETGTLANIADVMSAIRFVNADLTHLDVCMAVSKDMHVIMNLVGRTQGVGYSSNHHGEMLFHNSVVCLNMLEAARRNSVEFFLVVSSSCVYPDDAPIPTPELPVLSGLPESVNQGYGWAKRIAELQGQFYHNEYGMKIAIVRPFNPYGGRYLWRGDNNSHVVPTLVKKVMDGTDPLVVWGSGKQRRNFLHARDAVRLFLIVTERETSAQPVNIGYEEDISIEELVSQICEVTGRHPKIVFDTSKPEGRFRKCVDSKRLRRITDGYTPVVSLKEGLQDMMKWYYRTFQPKSCV